jgi:hypothetical protein
MRAYAMKFDMEIDLWYSGSMQKDNQECRCCRVCKFRSWVPYIYLYIYENAYQISDPRRKKNRDIIVPMADHVLL